VINKVVCEKPSKYQQEQNNKESDDIFASIHDIPQDKKY
jgi:hypothetical protein